MPINTKVNETGEYFEATSEEGLNRDVHELEEGKSYSGFRYPGTFKGRNSARELEFECTGERTQATFSAEALDEISLPIRVHLAYKKRKQNTVMVTFKSSEIRSTSWFDDPPKPGQFVELGGVQKKVTRVAKNQFNGEPPTYFIETE
jgi:hypothetical protein